VTIGDLPALNATLNGLSAILLSVGYVLIRRGDRVLHRKFMLAALASSTAFLASYIVYHANAGSRPFPGQGAIRPVYFAILVTHVVLAAVIVPLALVTAAREHTSALTATSDQPRWTLPIWLYVSVTGVVIYLMLYQLY